MFFEVTTKSTHFLAKLAGKNEVLFSSLKVSFSRKSTSFLIIANQFTHLHTMNPPMSNFILKAPLCLSVSDYDIPYARTYSGKTKISIRKEGETQLAEIQQI